MKELFDWITLAIAVAGFVLSIVNFIVDLVRHRPHAKVTFHVAVEADGYVRHLVTVVNAGETSLVISQVGLDCGKLGFIPVDAPFRDMSVPPKSVAPLDSAVIGLKVRTYLNRDLSHVLRAFVEIPGGRRFYSKAIKTDLVAFAIDHGIVSAKARKDPIVAIYPHGTVVGYAAKQT